MPTHYLLALLLVLCHNYKGGQVSWKYEHFIWAKAVNKNQPFIINQMCLYLIPLSCKFLKFWHVEFRLSLIKNIYRYCCRVNKLQIYDTFRAKQRSGLRVFDELTFTAPWYHLAEHWHFIVCKVIYLYEFKNWSAQKK